MKAGGYYVYHSHHFVMYLNVVHPNPIQYCKSITHQLKNKLKNKISWKPKYIHIYTHTNTQLTLE